MSSRNSAGELRKRKIYTLTNNWPGLIGAIGVAIVVALTMGVLVIVRDYAAVNIARMAVVLPVGYAFGAGMVASVNPCGFFVLPSYLSYYLGTEEKGYMAVPVLQRLGRAVGLALVVTLGFILVFASFGGIIALGGIALVNYFPVGGLLIGVALAGLGAWIFISRKPFGIMAASRVVITPRRNVWNVFLFGAAYAIGSLSCTLPIFLVVVGSALVTRGFGNSLGQFLGYSLGMGLVLAVVTVSAALFRDTVVRSIRGLMPHVHAASALFLVAAGSYLIYYWLRFGSVFG